MFKLGWCLLAPGALLRTLLSTLIIEVRHRVLLEKPHRQREHQQEYSLYQLRKRRHIGPKSREPPSPEGKRQLEASVGPGGFWQHAAPAQQNYNCIIREGYCFILTGAS
eukprot:1160727-Pelagomonas_calceolata.AAC.26